jgi:SAM-dependent methyltransferase
MARNRNIFRSMVRKVLPEKEYVHVSGSTIASPDMRWCGPEFKDDDFYLKSAEGEANRLVNHFQCTQDSRVLDVGCGQGRLPIGILRVIGKTNYVGIDVDRKSVDWCKRYIERDHPSFKFEHLNLYNERYNRNGIKMGDGFRFDIESKSVVFSDIYSSRLTTIKIPDS